LERGTHVNGFETQIDMKFNLFSGGVKKHLGHGFYHLGRNPALDWIGALGVFLVLTLLGLFLTIINRPITPVPPETENGVSKIFSVKLLDEVLIRYETKKKDFDSLLRDPINLADPSI